MRPFALLFFAALPAAAFSQTATKPSSPENFQKEALVFERSDTAIRMHADGTGERVMHVWLRLQSEGAARQFGVLSFSYAAANETPHITLARVHKPGGEIIDTPVEDAIDMPAAVTREAPLYSDLKEKHLPVRSLATGDTLEYEVHVTVDKPEAPGQFWGAQHFTAPGTFIVLAESFTLELPKGKYVQVWSPNHTPTITDHDGLRTYRWDQSQLIPAPKTNNQANDGTDSNTPRDPDEDPDGRKIPAVAWTTFHTWAEVGDWYRGLSLERAQPNDALRARAAEITKDSKTPEDQARAIYTFVSTHTRYVGINFGIGRYQPHSAAEVLANNYGDCKDKDTLLEALLRGKGFQTAPALIGVGVTPIEAVPSPAVFNHVITTVELPGGRIWLDSTPEVGPYRWLSASIRDQSALVVPAEGPAALDHTPPAPPYPLVAQFEATGALDAEGKFTSHITASYRTDDEVLVRQVARSVAPADLDKVSQYLSSVTGFGGTTSHTSITNPEDLASPIVLTYDYTRPSYGDWGNRRIVPCYPALEFGLLASDHNAPPEDIQLGAPRTLTAICRIRLPEGYRTDLPDPVHVRTDFTTFDKTYRFDGKDVVIERTIVVLAKKLPKTDWKRYQAFSKDISLDGEPFIQLITSPSLRSQPDQQDDRPKIARGKPKSDKPTEVAKGGVPSNSDKMPVQGLPLDGNHASSPAPAESTSATELMRSAYQQMQAHDLAGAKATLDKVKAKDPGVLGLWTLYGTAAAFQRNYTEAAADFKKELAVHPDLPDVVGLLAGVEAKSGDNLDARHTLQSYIEKHPGNLKLSLFLAQLQSSEQDYDDARKTLETAARENPEDRRVRVRLSDMLLRLNRKDEAAAVAKSALDGADDVEVMNDAGYVLAETGLDLPYAEEVSRKSIALLEAKTAAITPDEVNSSAFAQSRLLIASWDTLGWILFRQGKVEEAEPLIIAGWRNALAPESGDHLGQLYEAMGKKQEALSAFLLAAASIEGENVSPDVREHITKSITRLSGASAAGSQHSGTQALQDTRTYHVAKPAGVSGWGTFRLQINTVGVIASQQVSGDEKLSPITAKINELKLPNLVPPASAAHLLRSAIVSCSMGSSCDVVLVPNSSLQAEQ
jgi:transglutaminase-like putative cysteine protease/tetratricopeptide (TPR) repeat protein